MVTTCAHCDASIELDDDDEDFAAGFANVLWECAECAKAECMASGSGEFDDDNALEEEF